MAVFGKINTSPDAYQYDGLSGEKGGTETETQLAEAKYGVGNFFLEGDITFTPEQIDQIKIPYNYGTITANVLTVVEDFTGAITGITQTEHDEEVAKSVQLKGETVDGTNDYYVENLVTGDTSKITQ